MNIRFKLWGVPVVCLGLLAPGAWAQTALFAVETSVSTISPCPSFCGGPGLASAFDSDGGIGQSTSNALLNNADGNGRAFADLSGPTELPILKAEAFSNAQTASTRSSRVAAHAFGLQGFYVGGTSYSLDVTLSGIANDVPAAGAGVFNEDGSIVAHVMVIRDEDPGTDIAFSSDYASMKFEYIPSSDLTLLAEIFHPSGLTSLVIPADNTFHNLATTINVTGLLPGELIYVWASLSASGTRGGFGDAYSTLTMQFQDPTGLSHVAAIPEPAEYLMLLAGLGVLGAAKRRKRS